MADIVYHEGFAALGRKEVSWTGDTLKVALVTDSYSPDKDHTQYSDVSSYELSTAYGYTAGGATVAGSISDNDANDEARYDIADPSWTASGGSIGPARYAIVYDDTTTTKYLFYCFDFTTNQTQVSGGTLKITIDSTGLFAIKQAA